MDGGHSVARTRLLLLFCIAATAVSLSASLRFQDTKILREESDGSVDGFFAEAAPSGGDEKEGCCVRERRLKQVGLSVSGEELRVDVGHCRKRCPAKGALKRGRFEELLRENPAMDPRQVFRLHQSARSPRELSCPPRQVCSEADSRVELILTSEGQVSVDVVERCSCRMPPKVCRRQPKLVTFHKGTPLQTAVDVGECRGYCGHVTKCKPVVTKTTSIEGPNGVECISVVEDCLCASECYRLSHYEQLYDYIDGSPTVKVVDIGKCAGGCSRPRRDHCVQRKEDGGGCLVSLSESASECQPSSLATTGVTDTDGAARNVSSVESCACR